MKLGILLADSSIELVPRELQSHPAIISDSKRKRREPRDIILDITYHYSAMKGLKERWKRGRPDILHQSLLLLLNNPFLGKHELRIFFHTINGYVFEVSRDVRIPKHYDRFLGLMTKLLTRGEDITHKGKKLISRTTIQEVISSYKQVKILDEKGKRAEVKDIVQNDSLLIIGAFPKGDFSEEISSLGERFSLGEKPLETQHVINLIICRLINNNF